MVSPQFTFEHVEDDPIMHGWFCVTDTHSGQYLGVIVRDGDPFWTAFDLDSDQKSGFATMRIAAESLFANLKEKSK